MAGFHLPIKPAIIQPRLVIQPARLNRSALLVMAKLKPVLQIEIADTQAKRARGLGDRDNLAASSGMLFIFDSPTTAQFWMKGMRFPLDMIWISGDTIVGFEQNVPAPTSPNQTLPIYSPTQKIDKVLEVNAGFVQSHGIAVGDKLVQAQ
jgi:uncharacterized membrane protein (UPF0127 family)